MESVCFIYVMCINTEIEFIFKQFDFIQRYCEKISTPFGFLWITS